jgi:hypothetical protein
MEVKMYFHVYASHSSEICPMYAPEEMPVVLSAWERFRPFADELGVQVHYMAASAPSHEFFFLLEADSMNAISRLMFSIPIRQDIKIIPVELMEEAVTMAKSVTGAEE